MVMSAFAVSSNEEGCLKLRAVFHFTASISVFCNTFAYVAIMSLTDVFPRVGEETHYVYRLSAAMLGNKINNFPIRVNLSYLKV